MSLMGNIPQSDEMYPTISLGILEDALAWVQTSAASDHGGNPLFRLLSEMKNHTEFRPSYWSNELEPDIVGGRLEHREPVWKIFAEEFAVEAPETVERTEKALATWFQDVLGQVVKWRFLEQELETFSKNLKGGGIRVVVDESGPPAPVVQIHIDPEQSGENAKVVAERVITKLITRVTAHIQSLYEARQV